MNSSIDDRVLALAGLLQALTQVRRIADTGHGEGHQIETAINSVFMIDAADAETVYGGVDNLRSGLRQLRDYLANGNKDEAMGKLVLAVLQLERRFIRDKKMIDDIQAGLGGISPAEDQPPAVIDSETLAELGKLYSDTISTLRPRVMVQGNPHYLGQIDVVAEIRALLLAALRSAVLWRQMGGSLWDFVFQRRAMASAIDARMA
ncbi:MAG: high frequency lysogenization protein HflD [Thermomonas sp.]|uniref:high frequency lysogenization protein HflD n=1 Tax=Thermomonas sp. TaxID=1971895 RepID=UPI00260206AB|nr:high frequency lysogenization protein HflD [Thermomonas sp.]MCC7096654.1 high frequency lysogenization protein HflD [Thermomonas sp.]